VPPEDPEAIAEAIRRAVTEDDLVDTAAEIMAHGYGAPGPLNNPATGEGDVRTGYGNGHAEGSEAG